MTLTAAQSDELKRLAGDAMRAHGLLPDLPPAAIAQANAAAPANESGPEIRDLRALLWSSIDNDDSLDLDQIEVTETVGSRQSKLIVGIADVDSGVCAGTAGNEHALANTTSVRKPAETFSIEPERLYS